MSLMLICLFFFFQAEDGIRDFHVTGVQTCALPILAAAKQDDPSLDISEDILEHVARTVTASGRELEGAFNQLLFRQSFEQITVERIDEILGHIYRSGEPKRVRIEDIQRIVARHYNVSKTELLSNRRTRTIVKPRQVAMYLSKVMTPRSLPEIGRRFGGRD